MDRLIGQRRFLMALKATLSLLGLVIGGGRQLASQLFGISAFDLPAFALMTAILLCAALVATYVPALGATRVDPLAALRTE